MSADRHTMLVEIMDGMLYLRVKCPYDLADETRPCWALDVDGSLLPAPQPCNYHDWCDNLSPDELLGGDVTVEFAMEWGWHDFDSPYVTLLAPQNTDKETDR